MTKLSAATVLRWNHSDDPVDWVWPKQILVALPDVTVVIHYSRNHMRIKKGNILIKDAGSILIKDILFFFS